MAKSVIEPPKFISDEKTYAQYKADLLMWSRISGIDKKVQAEMVVYRLEGHPSRIKEKIVTQIGLKIIDSENGIQTLIEFLDTINDKDEMADVWDKFKEFSSFSRTSEQEVNHFMADWTNSYYKLKTAGCAYPDIILGFKLLEAAKLSEMDTKLVLTGVDYASAKTGRAVINGGPSSNLLDVKTEPAWLSEVEHVLLAKGWKLPDKKQ